MEFKRLEGIVEEKALEITALCSKLVQIPSEDPPGDTRKIASFIDSFFKKHDVDSSILAAHDEKPNVVATIDGGLPGPHIVFNGHMDTYPVVDSSLWTEDPFGGKIKDGKMFGRGVADMKGGLASSIIAVCMLNKIKNEIPGKVSVTCVSDEEVGGLNGTRFLLRKYPELYGDGLISGEPSSTSQIRIGERGRFWFRVTCKTKGGHGAYSLVKESAIKRIIGFISEVEVLNGMKAEIPQKYIDLMENARNCYEELLGKGATELVLAPSVNVGTIQGGTNINLVPQVCSAEMDFRLPPGAPESIFRDILANACVKYPDCTLKEFATWPPYVTEPENPLVQLSLATAKRVTGKDVFPTFAIGGAETRLWRRKGIPAVFYGPNHHNMGSPDEYIIADELFDVVKVHAYTAYNFLKYYADK